VNTKEIIIRKSIFFFFTQCQLYFFPDWLKCRLHLGDNRWMAGLRNRPRSRAGELTCVTPKTMQQLPQHSLSAPGRHAFNFMADRWQQLQFGDIKFWHWIITAKGVDDTPNSPACRLLPPLTPRCPFIKSRTSPSPWPIINSAHSSGSLCMWNFHRGASSVGLIEEVALGPGAPRRGGTVPARFSSAGLKAWDRLLFWFICHRHDS